MAAWSEEEVDLVVDLGHDLGKYLSFPLSFLPPSAPDPEVRKAVSQALHRTRELHGVARPAAELWNVFLLQLSAARQQDPGFAELRLAVQRALGWDAALEQEQPLPREAVARDFNAVGETIRQWLRSARG